MPSGIYKKTEEHKKRLSDASKDNKNWLGKYHSEESKIKMSLTKKGKKFSEEHKRKMSESQKGKHLSEETKRKMSKAHKGNNYNLGKHHAEETKRKISEANKGENHPNWKGGLSFEPYTLDWTETLKKAIRERDHYICQLCSQYGNVIHHKNYDKKNCNPDNLITLCGSCNSKVNYNRDYWFNYFNKI